MIPSRRIAFAAAAVILGLSACGDASNQSTGATVVTPTTTPLPLIRLGGSSAGGAAATMAADESLAPGERMMVMRMMNFVFTGTADLPAAATAWTFPANPVVDRARIAELAGLLGVAGEVRALPADQGGGWMVGAADYSDANLTISADGMTSWWFSPSPSVYEREAVSCPAYDPATDTTVPVCPEPEPPAGVPGADEAKANATALFTSMGYDMANYELDVYADEWSANVTAYLTIGGARSPISLSAGYGANGALTWASGNLATPQVAGDYPLVSAQDAVTRLNDQQGMWGPYMEGDLARTTSAGGAVAVGETTEAGTAGAPSVDPALPTEVAPPESLPTDGASTDVPADTMVIAPAPGDPVLIDPMPVDTIDTTPIDVALTTVKLDLTMQWDVDGTVWLLPAYTFGDAEGGMYTVIAVADEYIQQPEVPEPVALPAVEPVIEPAVEPVSPDTVSPDPAVPVEIDLAAASAALAGLTEAEATAVAEANGWTMRVVELDGESLPVTMDFQFNRVNVAVTGGVVTAATSIG